MSEPKKGLLMRRDEFIRDLERVLNGHDLPTVVIQPIVADFMRDIEGAMNRQYAQEQEEYKKALEEKSAEDESGEVKVNGGQVDT